MGTVDIKEISKQAEKSKKNSENPLKEQQLMSEVKSLALKNLVDTKA